MLAPTGEAGQRCLEWREIDKKKFRKLNILVNK